MSEDVENSISAMKVHRQDSDCERCRHVFQMARIEEWLCDLTEPVYKYIYTRRELASLAHSLHPHHH